MKTKKGSLRFLFLCLMGVLMVSAPISPLHHDSIGVVYAEEVDEEEVEEPEEPPAPAEGSNGNYENLQIPAILSTAYADGLRLAELDDSADHDVAAVFHENMDLLMNNPDTAGKYQFDTMGVFMGPIGQSSGSGTNDVASTLSIGLPQLRTEYSFDKNLGEAYWTFGRAVQNLRTDASKADTSTINATAAIDALAGISTQVANIGIRLLRDWSPAPVVLAFSDSDVLHQAEYQSNQLIKMVHQVETAYNIVSFFGSSVPGIPQLSYAQLITLIIIMFGLILSILTVFIGERFFSVSVKKAFVKVMVMIIAVPLTMHAYDWGLQTLDAVAGDATQTTEYQQARSHLLLGQWAEKGFAVPAGRTLTVQDGRFVLSRDDIRAINSMLVEADDDQKIADEITRQVASDNNETNISWQSVIVDGGGRPWRTNRMIEIATALGNGQPVADNTDANMADNAVGYLYGSGLRSSKGTNGNFTYTQNGAHGGVSPYSRFGINPVANYNLLNTSFNTNGLSVKSNLSTGSSLPSVAPTAYAYSIGGVGAGDDELNTKMPAPVRWLVQFTLMIASIKALATILTSGFGGMLNGGVRSMFGSSSGWGELLGAIFAAIFGVIGLSLFSLLALQVTHVLYGTMRTMTENLIDGSGMSTANNVIAHMLSPTKWISFIPGVSDPIAGMINDGLDSLVASVMALLLGIFLLPKFIKIPIEAFATWISSLPQSLAQKAQDIENRFTGDYRAGGGSTGALAGAMSNAGSGMLNSGAAVAAGGGMIAGAAIKSGGGAIASGIGSVLGKGKDGGGDGEDTENKGTASVAAPDKGETDANGNPITENVSDSEETVEGATSAEENSQEGDAVGGDTESDESATSDDDRTEGDAVGGDVNAEESSVSDMNSAEGDAVDGDVSAEDSVASEDSAVEGDSSSEDSSVSDENSAQGDAVSGDVNAEDSSVSDENNAQGDVNDDRSAVEGDVNSNDGSVSGETTSEGDAVGGDTSADGDSVSSNDSSVAGGTSANSSSVAGGTSSSDSSVAGGTSSNNSSVAGGTSSSDSSVAGGTSSSDSSAEGDAVGGDVNASNATTGDDVSTSDSVTGGTTSATDSTVGGESVSEGSSNIGGDTSTTGDMSTSDSTVGSEGSGQGSSVSDGSADSGTNYEAHSESSVGGPVSEGGVSDGGTSITNDASTEGAQVSNDTTTADANVTQDASASINQSTEDRTMQQEGNADNRQSADINSNSQTVNDSQSTVAGGSQATGTQGGATSTGKQGSATSTGKQGGTSTGKQGSATSTGKQGGTSAGKQGSATSTGKQGGTAASANGSTTIGGQATPANGQAVPAGGRTSPTGKQSGASTAQAGNQGRSATAPTGQQSNSTPTGQQSRSTTTPTGQQRSSTTAPTGQQRGTPQGQKGTATIDSRGTVTASKQGTQSKGGNESTSEKAGRLGRMFNGAKNSTAKQGNVSNAQQAAMGAVHVMGGLTGTQNITQKGVDNMKRRQGKDVGAKEGANSSGQNASNSPQNERQQQIIDMERREQDEQRKNKKPSFIESVRNNNK